MRLKAIIVAVVALAAIVSLYWGVQLRREIWQGMEELHFTNDARNAWLWGRNARAMGIFNLYDDVEQNQPIGAVYPLDYAPLRLSAAMAWQAWTQRNFPDAARHRLDYEFMAPMLWGNTISALVSSVFAFLLVRTWVLRMDESGRVRAIICGTIAGLLLWFNPGALWDGYVWGQWEIWIIPFYLAAVYFACKDWWFAAGSALAVGGLIKPQLLVAAPVLFLWPIFQLRFGALLRLVAGMSLVVMVIVFPWLKPSPSAFVWYLLMLTAIGVLTPLVLRWKINWRWAAGLAAAAMYMAWPWKSDASFTWQILPVITLGLIMLCRFLPSHLIPYAYALIIAVAIVLMIPLFNASSAWFTRGFIYGPQTRPQAFQRYLFNVPAMGSRYLRWANDPDYRVVGEWSMWAFMLLLQGICLLLCGIGAALQHRRNDARFLIAMFLPWLTFYLLLTQQQSRYLMWAAVISSLLVGVSVGMALFGILITLLAWMAIDQNMHESHGIAARIPQLEGLDPHIGWVLLLMAAIMLYNVLVPRTRLTMS